MFDLAVKINKYQYTSMEYADIEAISSSVTYIDTDDSLFLYSVEDEKAKIDWATNTKESFFDGLKKTINQISRNHPIKKIYIEFIPEDYVHEMEELGFIIASEFIDFWNNRLEAIDLKQQDSLIIRKIKEDEYHEASEVSKSCKGYSRGFEGESDERIKEWNESENSSIFAAEKNSEIIGICCVNLYGHESAKGTVLWIREIAVKPSYHSQKIGFHLLAYAINWGINNGAVRSFLLCDAENVKAIRLYEGLGYERKPARGQINMELGIDKGSVPLF